MMKKEILILVCVLMIAMQSKGQGFIENNDYVSGFVRAADSLVKVTPSVSAEEAKRVLTSQAISITVDLGKKSKKTLTANQVYERAKAATVVMGSAYLCPKCSHTHVGPASGYVIDPKGIVVTNYHVVQTYAYMRDGNKPIAFMARMANGKTYAVKQVLTASEEDDLALLQLETNGDILPSLNLADAAKVGDKAYVLGHPQGFYYYFTEGIVNHKHIDHVESDRGVTLIRPTMAISADYAVGSSGGPVLNSSGDIIGTVSATRTLTYSNDRPMVQMILKKTIPVESLRKLIR